MKQGLTTKQGVSLVVLIITIIVAIALLSVSVVAVKNSVDNAAVTAFAQDLSTIGEMTQDYYLKNEDYPKLTGTDAMSQGDVLNLAGGNANALLEEMRLNNDIVANDSMGTYYQLDITKLNIAKTTRGTQKDGATDDVYVVCYPSQNVYYVKGLKAKGQTYFSLSSKLVDITKVEKKISDDTFEVQTAAGMTAKKEKKTWTNTMGIQLQIVLEPGDELYIKAGKQDPKLINTYVGTRSYTINQLADLKDVSSFTAADDTTFNALPQAQKQIEIIKMRNTVEKGKIVLDLSNYEKFDPFKVTEPTLVEGEEANVVKFQVKDNNSGIKEVRYEYLKKFNDEGQIVDYYEGVDTLDVNYMKSRAKKAKIDKEGNVEVTVPKDIEGIQMLVLDKAGNGIVIKQNTASTVYIGIVPKEITLSKVTFKLVFHSKYGVRNVATSISTDGTTYTTPVAVNNFQSTAIISMVDVDHYTNVDGASNGVYVKATAQDNSSGSGSNIKLLGKDNAGKLGTRDKYASTWDNPYIPVGFEHLEGSVQDGFVIKDVSGNEQTDGNEFVWIPVKDMSAFKMQHPVYDATKPTQLNWVDYSNHSGYVEITTTDEYQAMKNSVAKYGGFYVARYEAGVAKNMPQQKPTTNTTVLYGDGSYKPVSQKDTPVWNFLAWGGSRNEKNATDGQVGNDRENGAVKVARAMYPNIEKVAEYQLPSNITSQTDVVSTLCYDVQWDAIMMFLQDIINPTSNKPYVVSSQNMGNLADSNADNNPALTGDSSYTQYKTKNIYDLAGNVIEWTMSTRGTASTVRGYRGGGFGSLNDGSLYGNASSSDNYYVDGGSVGTGFRPALYIN